MDSRLRQVRIETVLRRLIAGDETVESAALRIMREGDRRILIGVDTAKGYHNWIFRLERLAYHAKVRQYWRCEICGEMRDAPESIMDGERVRDMAIPDIEGCKGKQNGETDSEVLPVSEDCDRT